ncbi:MAG: ATP-binding protein [Candidatus Thiodiazotropha sp.]
MRVLGIKSKLLLSFITVLVIITGLNVGLATYLTNQQGEREAFASLIRQSVLLQNELKETIDDLKAIAEKNVAGSHNLSDLATLYAKTEHLITYPDQASKYERGLLFNKIISLNRLKVILQTADFSTAAVYLDNKLSHYLTTTEAGMNTIRVDDRPLFKTGQDQAGELRFDNWPNWDEGDPAVLITDEITPVNRPTINFDFTSNEMMVLQIVIPVQAITRTVMRENITLGSPEGLLVDDLAIATPETLSQSTPKQNQPAIIGAFVFRKVFDREFLQEIAKKTGLLPALYSPDGVHQIQLIDMKIDAAELAQWALESQEIVDRQIHQHTIEVDRDSYYQTLSLWRFDEQPRLIIGFSQSTASTLQKVRETVTGLITIAGLVLLVGTTLGYLLFDRLVKPIRTLTAAVSNIGLNIQREKQGQAAKPISSDKLVGIDLHTNDEVGQLATAFNTMSRELRLSFETLEQRVVERTEELQRAKDQAEAANKAKSVFLANMSHELRTPLNAVLGFSQVMRNSPDVTPSQTENLNIITRSGEHLLNLINNVLDISKIESGRVELEESHVYLYRLLEEIKSLMYVRAHGKDLVLTLEQSPDLPGHINADASKLRQVLINLVGNAIKYTPSGAVAMRAMVTEKQNSIPMRLRFEIEDTGPGMKEEDRERIFSPFEQLDNRETFETGTGLGLSIAKQYVELMGGMIGVDSEWGKGSIFYFEIPVEVVTAVASTVEPQHGRVLGLAEGERTRRLLIVEDQPENRLLLHKLLAPLGFELQEAVNGQQAVDLSKQWHPHLIFMDIRMPLMDGLEATRRIKAMDIGIQTKIVALTAHALEEERRDILAAGCDDFIRKPYKDNEIFDTLTKHLNVRFDYEGEASAVVDAKIPLTAAAVAELPDKLRNDLKQALLRLDTDEINKAIVAIRAHDTDTANALDAVAKDLQYGRILHLIEAS